MKVEGIKRLKVGRVRGLWLNNGRKEFLKSVLYRSRYSNYLEEVKVENNVSVSIVFL